MSSHFNQDRWLLPSQQTEYPGRPLLSETTLHGRREATFLVLAALYFVATTAFVVLGTSRVIDLSALIARIAPDVPQRIPLVVPLGVIPFALSIVASSLACELLGRRRASAVVLFGAITSAALVGLMRSADLIDGGQAFVAAAALSLCSIVAHTFNLALFDLLRRATPARQLFGRLIIASWLSIAMGWALFAAALRSGYLAAEPIPSATITALAVGSAIVSAALVLALAIPAAVVARGLALALRVGPSFFTRHDEIVDDEDDLMPAEPAWTAPRRAFAEGSVARPIPHRRVEDEPSDGVPRHAHPMEIRAFTSAEMQFFADGDEELA